jgi:hypothetical protein
MAKCMIVEVIAISAPSAAQWLSYPTPGIPRTAGGKPNLSAGTTNRGRQARSFRNLGYGRQGTLPAGELR